MRDTRVQHPKHDPCARIDNHTRQTTQPPRKLRHLDYPSDSCKKKKRKVPATVSSPVQDPSLKVGQCNVCGVRNRQASETRREEGPVRSHQPKRALKVAHRLEVVVLTYAFVASKGTFLPTAILNINLEERPKIQIEVEKS